MQLEPIEAIAEGGSVAAHDGRRRANAQSRNRTAPGERSKKYNAAHALAIFRKIKRTKRITPDRLSSAKWTFP
jgi:hypothetical protein